MFLQASRQGVDCYMAEMTAMMQEAQARSTLKTEYETELRFKNPRETI